MSNLKQECKKLTFEELRNYKGFENISDMGAIDYIASMEQFCIIAYELFKQQKLIKDEHQS